jgi:hypothetical protein
MLRLIVSSAMLGFLMGVACGNFGSGVLATLLALVYFLPAGVAHSRNHHQLMAIFVLNLLLGWTFIGWVACMVWACTMVKPHEKLAMASSDPAWLVGSPNRRPW